MPDVEPDGTLTENWFALVGRFLGGYRDDYVVMDVETNGHSFDPADPGNLIMEVGFLKAVGRLPESCDGVILDWTLPGYGVDPDVLGARLEKTRAEMAKRGDSYHLTLERVRDEGVDPREGLSAFVELARDSKVVGFNFWNFDRRMIEAQVRRLGLPPFRFGWDSVVDCGLIEKARGLRLLPPLPGEEPICRWYDRVLADPRRVRWNMSRHCAQVYGLDVDPARAHGAAYDCQTNFQLYERIRQLAEE